MSTPPIAGEESGTASDWNTKQESWLHVDQKVKDKASELLEFCLPHPIFTLPQLSPL